MSEIEKLKTELERTRAVVEANKRNFELAFAGMKAELKRVNAACAMMREVLLMAKPRLFHGPTLDCKCECCETHRRIDEALTAASELGI